MQIHRARPVVGRTTLLATFAGLIVLLCAASPGKPYFDVKPDPPTAGSDVEVVYHGSDGSKVVYQVGDGEFHRPKVGSDGKFKIPKALLKVGLKLKIRDGALDELPEGSVCFEIEP